MERVDVANYGNLILRTRHRATKGRLGEYLVRAILASQGYGVKFPEKKCQGDLHATDLTTGEIIKLEVKTATRTARGDYQAILHKSDKYGGTDCHHADIVILVCVTNSGSMTFFVVPADEIKTKSLTITGNPHEYRGKYSQFRQYHSTLNLRTDVRENSDRVGKAMH